MAIFYDKYRIEIIDDFNSKRKDIGELFKKKTGELLHDINEIEYTLKYDDKLSYVFKQYNQKIENEIGDLFDEDFEEHLKEISDRTDEICKKISEESEEGIKYEFDKCKNTLKFINEGVLDKIDGIVSKNVEDMIMYYYDQLGIPYDKEEGTKIIEYLIDEIKPKTNTYKKELLEKTEQYKDQYFDNAYNKVVSHKREKDEKTKTEQVEFKTDAVLSDRFEPEKANPFEKDTEEKLKDEERYIMSNQTEFKYSEIREFEEILNAMNITLKDDEESKEVKAYDEDNKNLSIEMINEHFIINDNKGNIYKAFYVNDEKTTIGIDKNDKEQTIELNKESNRAYFRTKDFEYLYDPKSVDVFKVDRLKREGEYILIDEFKNDLKNSGIKIEEFIKLREEQRDLEEQSHGRK